MARRASSAARPVAPETGVHALLQRVIENSVARTVLELSLATVAFLLYFIVRASVVDRPELALANARELIDVERSLGIFTEAAWQRWALDNYPAVKLSNFAYFWLDFPLIGVVGML